MNRHFQYAALVLRLRALGGAGEMSHREGYFLTPREGVVRAAVYGGAKSKLRAYVSPFQSGTLYLYHNPARDTRKVCDFDVSAWRPEIRERLERTLTASAVAEALLAGQGGGSESAAAFALANQTLDALACAGEKLCEKVYVHFLWHWLDILGL
ncbi:MAG: DNA repair protein RecO, partial [Spirochaetaceae bacterium]|nr:DNA repair protein RecO [Spirochaetaceae bacterium]